MFLQAIELLKIIENKGFKAYLVGGTVRDYLLLENEENIKNITDFDICSNINEETIFELFEVKSSQYGSYKIAYKNINYDLTILRKESIDSLDNRHPNSIIKVDDYKEDSLRRDFTVNSIYMDSNYNIYDPQSGIIDLNNQLIRLIGNKQNRFIEDSTRILRCIYFKLKLGFKIEEETYLNLINNVSLVNKINNNILLDLFTKIFKLNKFEEFINDLYNTNIYYYLNYFNKTIEFCFKNKVKDLSLIEFLTLTNLLDNTFITQFQLSKKTKNDILEYTKLFNSIKEREINNFDLYTYGLQTSLIVIKLKNLLCNQNISLDKIINQYNNLSIKSDNGINFKVNDLKNNYKLKSNKYISVIMNDIKQNILFKKILNEYNEIKTYIENKYIGSILMNNREFISYLDEFNTIVALVKKEDAKYIDEFELFKLLDKDFKVVEELKIKNIQEEYDCIKYYLQVNSNIFTHVDYYLEKHNFNYSYLKLGSITRSDLYDKTYAYYKDDLGFTYSKESTTFKVWSPASKEMYLELVDKKNNITLHQMRYSHPGVYTTTIKGDLELHKYRFKLRVNEEFVFATDPYSVSSTIDQKYSYVLDKNKYYKFKNERPQFSGIYNDMVIYEASIRDLASYYNETSIRTLINHNIADYVSNLGITHIQFMPLFKFYGINPKDLFEKYNWGYNPEKYNEVEISFSSNMKNPYQAINDLRELVDTFFSKGVSVNMDVVFNHVNDLEEFSYQKFVPGYFYWYDDNKFRTEFSFCGNDLNSKRAMTRKLINDSLKYWMDTFNICGFRFDLMGLIDLDSMNYFANNVISNYDKAVIYGEGWHMKSLLKNNEKGSMNNANRMPNIAFFNDYFRDNIRTKDRTFKGFIDGKNYNIKNTYNCLLGSNHMFKGSYQSLNYVECHDNYTLFDQLRVNKVDNENIYDLHVLTTSLVIISLGVPFLHCGQELFRSKYLVENSYNSLDIINMIDYKRMEEYSWYINLVRDLISIRKEYIAFRRNNSDNVTILNREQDSHNIVLKYHEEKYNLYCIIKNDYVLFDYTFNNQVECIFNGLKKDNMKVKNVLLSKPGVYIYKENLNE